MRSSKALRFILLMWLCTTVSAQFQAQDGWSLPKQLNGVTVPQGIVVDASQQRVFAVVANGIRVWNAKSFTQTAQIERLGARGLVGVSNKSSGTVLLWRERSTTDGDGIWTAWSRARASALPSPQLVAATSSTQYAVSMTSGEPTFFFTDIQGEETVVYAKIWDSPARKIYQTRLNIGALAVAATQDGVNHIVFAEGYRNQNDEKYNAVLLSGRGETWSRTALGPAVYQGTGQRFMVALHRDQAQPVWLWETPEAQRAAALTGRHQPQLAIWREGRAQPFALVGQPIGQIESRIYWRTGSRVQALELENGVQQSTPLLSPTTLSEASVSGGSGYALVGWQTLNSDGQSSLVYVTDTTTPYVPTASDRIAVALGWNPYYLLQSAFAQTLISILLAALIAAALTPLFWLLLGALPSRWRRFAIGAATALAWGFVAILGAIGQLALHNLALQNWSFAPLLTPAWWLIVIALIVGTLIAWASRKRFLESELAPVIASTVITFTAMVIIVFSKAGFIQF